MNCEVMCHGTHSIDSSLLSNRGITVTRRGSSIRHAHKAECCHRRHRRDTRASARRTAERSNTFSRITSSQLQFLEHTGSQLPVSGAAALPESGAPTLTRPKLLLVGLKLPLFSSDLVARPDRQATQWREPSAASRRPRRLKTADSSTTNRSGRFFSAGMLLAATNIQTLTRLH